MGRSDAVAAVFDCDGTLVDSEPLAGEAWRRALKPYGYAVTDEDLANTIGIPYARTHAYLAEQAEIPTAAALWPELSRELFALIDARADAVRRCPAGGRGSATAGRGDRGRVLVAARAAGPHAGPRAACSSTITIAGDEVEHGKPAPDMFLLAAERLGVEPARCVVIEDSPPGVAAGKAAGHADARRPARAPHGPLARPTGSSRP